MPALQFDDDHPVFDPDTLKVPEASAHRQAIDLIGLVASSLLDAEWRLFRDMNWYPTDGGGPVAPDIMVLPAEATEPSPTSYRQDQTGGPVPSVVVEVPSESDSFSGFRAKTVRYQRLGTVVYIVAVSGPGHGVLRLGPGDPEPQAWVARPIDELGGFSLAFDGGQLVATTPGGVRATSDVGLLAESDARTRSAEAQARLAEAQARSAEAQARSAEAQARSAEARAEALLQQLRALGTDPEPG